MEQYKWSSYMEYFQEEKVKEKDKIVDKKEVLDIFLSEKERTKEEFFEFNKKVFNFQESIELLEYEMKSKLTDEEVIYFIKKKLEIYNIQEIQKYSKNDRDKTIRKIKKFKGITQKQVARILGINIRIIQRA